MGMLLIHHLDSFKKLYYSFHVKLMLTTLHTCYVNELFYVKVRTLNSSIGEMTYKHATPLHLPKAEKPDRV